MFFWHHLTIFLFIKSRADIRSPESRRLEERLWQQEGVVCLKQRNRNDQWLSQAFRHAEELSLNKVNGWRYRLV